MDPQTELSSTDSLPLSKLTSVYEEVGEKKGESSKAAQRELLSNMFRKLLRHSPEELIRGYWLSVLRTGPQHLKEELGLGREMLVKAVAHACGLSQKQVREQATKLGDLGQAAQEAKANQRTMDSYFKREKVPVPLSTRRLFEDLKRIARCKGSNSAGEKQSIFARLLLEASFMECKFIVRWVQGNLKIAAAQKTMLRALVTALFYELFPKSMHHDETVLDKYELVVKQAVAQFPDEQKIINALLQLRQDFHRLPQFCTLKLGVPCKPMLAKPTKNIGEILTRFEGRRLTCEFKYDGLRGQVHSFGGQIRIFSRNLEEITAAYQDIVLSLTIGKRQQTGKSQQNSQQRESKRNGEEKEIVTVMPQHNGEEKEIETVIPQHTRLLPDFILDCEIVAVNKRTGQLLPFQTLATRSRKGVAINEIEVHVNLYAFDLLYYGRPLITQSLQERRNQLMALKPLLSSDMIKISEHSEVDDFDRIDQFLKDAITQGTQGLMIKDLSSPYTCARRSWEWVKLKKDYIDGLGDTLDLVPVGALFGTGKRKGLYGSFLLAVYNEEDEVYETICKIGTGFSDQVLQHAFQFFQEHLVGTQPREYRTALNSDPVDVWFQPCAVWEVKGADFQLSPVYTCGIGCADPNRGIGLRFPRLLAVRSDKKPHQASTNIFVHELYRQQAVVRNANTAQNDDDFY